MEKTKLIHDMNTKEITNYEDLYSDIGKAKMQLPGPNFNELFRGGPNSWGWVVGLSCSVGEGEALIPGDGW